MRVPAAPSAAPATPAAAPPPPVEDLPEFLRFAPVPVKARRDGWTPALQMRFVLALARGVPAAEAARGLGRSRQTAYALRRRAGAEGFTAAWDAAVAFAARMRGAAFAAGRAAPGGIGTLLVPRFYRGRLVGYVQRDDVRGAMALLGRLDRLADRVEARGTDRAAARRLRAARAAPGRRCGAVGSGGGTGAGGRIRRGR